MSSSSSSSSAASGPPGLTLSRYDQTIYENDAHDAYRIRIEVSNAENIDAEIFVMRRDDYNFDTGTKGDEFDAICSTVDLDVLPVDAPDTGEIRYRVSSLDLAVRSKDEADKLWNAVVTRVRALKAALVTKAAAEEAESVTLEGI